MNATVTSFVDVFCPQCGSGDIRGLSKPDPTAYDSGKEAVAACEDCGEPLSCGEVST